MLARANVDATYLQHFVKDRRDGEALLAAAEHADLGDDATCSGRRHRLLKSARAAHFDGQIHTSTAGLTDRPPCPLRVFPIIMPGVQAELRCPVQLAGAG